MSKRTSGMWTIQMPGGVSPPEPPPRERVYPLAPLLRPPHYVIYVANREGQFIGELTPWGYLESAPAAMDSYTTTALHLSPGARRAAPRLLDHGNLVLVVFDNGYPMWGGVLDPPHEGAADASRITLYSGEYLLSWYKTPFARPYPVVYRYEYPAVILSDLVEKATWDGLRMLPPVENRAEGERITISFGLQTVLSAAGHLLSRAPDLHWRARPVMRSDRSGFDFQLEMFHGIWRARTAAVALVRGVNFAEVQFISEGPIVNWLAVDMPNQTGDELSYTVLVEDETSAPVYGRRWGPRTVTEEEAAVDLPAERMVETAQEIAAAEFTRTARPARRVRGKHLNVPPARYGAFEVGDLITVELGGLSGIYNAQGLVTALQYDPTTGTAEVVVELQRQQ